LDGTNDGLGPGGEAVELSYQEEQDILDTVRLLDDSVISSHPVATDLTRRVLASMRGETITQRERPDFEDPARSLLFEVMRVDDHPRPNGNDATRARESAVLRELRQAGFGEAAPNASVVANVSSGLPGEADHNYEAYVSHFQSVVGKHAQKVAAYRAEQTGFDLGFLIFDESTAYAELLGSFGGGRRGRAHAWFTDAAFIGALRAADIDFVAWLTPYKMIISDRGPRRGPELTILDLRLLSDEHCEVYEAKRMRSAEA
jgi:hypothetical protein